MKMRLHEMVRQDCHEVLAHQSKTLSALAGSTVTIVGGTGFVGTWLAEMLACLNDEFQFNTQIALVARGVEHFSRVRPHLATRRDVKLIKSDVRHTFEIPRETSWLVHAAATPDGRAYSTNPIDAMGVITSGTEALLRATERCSSFKMFLNLSSAAVYGPQPLDLPGISETFPGSPEINTVNAAYAEAKRYAETLCSVFRSQSRIPVVTARPFAFIGPYQSLTSPWAINSFINDSLLGRTIRVLGDGRTIRSYMYPSDMALWMLRILCQAQTGASYNVGSPEPISLGDLANRIASHFETKPDVVFSQGTGGALKTSRLVPDVTRAKTDFGLNLTVSLQEALARTIKWNTASMGEVQGLS